MLHHLVFVFKVQDMGVGVCSLGFTVWDLECGVQSAGLRGLLATIWGLEFRVQGAGLRGLGLGSTSVAIHLISRHANPGV